MSACWKCGRQLPEGRVECEGGFCEVNDFDEDAEEFDVKEFKKNWLELDWSKVKTLEDLIDIISKHGGPIYVEKETSEAERLKKFLKPIE